MAHIFARTTFDPRYDNNKPKKPHVTRMNKKKKKKNHKVSSIAMGSPDVLIAGKTCIMRAT